MDKLVIVEASGKTEALRVKLKAIGIYAEVMATVGHIADNPSSIDEIALDHNLHETNYSVKANRRALVDKLARAANSAEQIYLAMDDDQEGDVIAYDLSIALSAHAAKLQRVPLRSLTTSELSIAFAGRRQREFAVNANNGICRRILDRAIGATFTIITNVNTIPVGRVQSSLLASIEKQPLPIGKYLIEMKRNGSVFQAEVPVFNSRELVELERIVAALSAGNTCLPVTEERTFDVALAKPWGYEEIILESSARLGLNIQQAAEALQVAYERGRVTYPRTRKNSFTPDAVEIAAALARQNRTHFDGSQVPLREATGEWSPHESPRPIDEDMLLGRSLSLLDVPEAVAVLVARNMIECGQVVPAKSFKISMEERDLLFTCLSKPPLKNWKVPAAESGYQALPPEVTLLKYMTDHNLGRPSTVVAHVTKFLSRGLIQQDGKNRALTPKGELWLEHAKKIGFTENTSQQMEALLAPQLCDPYKAAAQILKRFGMFDAVKNKIQASRDSVKTKSYEIPLP